jgi:PPOX class probable F420-dependent enzyme
MAVEIPTDARKLLEAPNLAHVVTLMRDGSPQVTPVWVDVEGGQVLINTAEGRQKMRNLRRDPRIALSVVDKERALNYVTVRGRVVEMTHEGAWEHINKLSHKYNGRDYPRTEGQQRVLIRIEPTHLSMGFR